MTVAAAHPASLSPLELATGIAFGRARGHARLERRVAVSPRTAIDQALLPALRRPPCIVTFSGGRDSSALLAVATRVALREGLAAPIPATLRFPDAHRTDETEWQETLVRRLGCSDWVRLEHTDELDLVGPVARRVMGWTGIPYPYNLHLLVPLMEVGPGGSFVTGVGGDQSLVSAGRALDVLAGRIRPETRDGLRLAAAAAPPVLRRAALRGRTELRFPWMTLAGNEALAEAWLDDVARRPLRWNARLREMWRSRFTQLTIERIADVGAQLSVEPVHPFLDVGFLSSLAADAGATGFADRGAAMRALFAEDLPDRVLARNSKASFNEVLWNRHTNEFLSGTGLARLKRSLASLGVDRLVDPDALVEHWRRPDPLSNSFSLLQACWLVEQG